MKDNLFELLLSLVEKTISQLKEKRQININNGIASSDYINENHKIGVEVQILKNYSKDATRVFTADEQLKLTKASYQYLLKIFALGIISSSLFELIINRLSFSDSRFVSLQETKWTIKTTLERSLTLEQKEFLDLILYCKEDNVALH